MRGEARVVQHHSGARNAVKRDEDVSDKPSTPFAGHYEPERYLAESRQSGTLGGDGRGARFPRYRQAKLSQALFALELHRRLQQHWHRAAGPSSAAAGGIKSLSAEPGLVRTNLGVNFLSTFPLVSPLRVLIPMAFPLPDAQPVAHGAIPLLRACFDPSAMGGDLWVPRSWVRGRTVDEVADKARPLRILKAGRKSDNDDDDDDDDDDGPSAPAMVVPVRSPDEYGHEELTLNESFAQRMWKASEKAVGKFDVGEVLANGF